MLTQLSTDLEADVFQTLLTHLQLVLDLSLFQCRLKREFSVSTHQYVALFRMVTVATNFHSAVGWTQHNTRVYDLWCNGTHRDLNAAHFWTAASGPLEIVAFYSGRPHKRLTTNFSVVWLATGAHITSPTRRGRRERRQAITHTTKLWHHGWHDS